jgi:Flp pilus assembly protein TadG
MPASLYHNTDSLTAMTEVSIMRSKRSSRLRRRGISTIWLMATLPIMLIMLGIVVNVANLWLARIELENALEAAALAAVKEWGDASGGVTDGPRDVGVAYAAANNVRCVPLTISTNLDASPSANNPNANLVCNPVRCDRQSGTPPGGNLIFGAITDDDPANPITFNAGISGGCIPATVFIEITKTSNGADTEERMFGVFFNEGPDYLSIQSVSFTIPVLTKPNQPSQQPFFDGGSASAKQPTVSTQDGDIQGLLTTDVSFSFSDEVDFGEFRYRTFTTSFTNEVFNPPIDPNPGDFVRFGASINQMNPPVIRPPAQNDGESFHLAPVRVTVVFYDSSDGSTRAASGVFIDDEDPSNGRAIMTLGGGSGDAALAVRAQAIVSIQSIWSRLLLLCSRPLCVSACATAAYDCSTGRVELIRVDRFICPGP